MEHKITLTEAQICCLIDVITNDINLSGEDALCSVNLEHVETCEHYYNRAVLLKILKGLPQ